MKKHVIVCTFLFFLFSVFAQSEGYRGQRKTLDNVECKITNATYSSNTKSLDIFFSVAVDPRTVSSNNIFIDNSPISKNAKITFNKDGTQVRISISNAPPFSLKISNIKSYDGKSFPSFSKKF